MSLSDAEPVCEWIGLPKENACSNNVGYHKPLSIFQNMKTTACDFESENSLPDCCNLIGILYYTHKFLFYTATNRNYQEVLNNVLSNDGL